MSKRTPLHSCHLELGARMVEFAGWEMPLQYRGIVQEHEACRRRAAVFDVCHMGEIEVHGDDVRSALNAVLSNDLAKAPDGAARYGFILNDDGGIADDVITFVFDASRAIVVTNAANTEGDLARLAERCPRSSGLRDASERLAKIDLQGPRSRGILGRALEEGFEGLGRFRLRETSWRNSPLTISRTGYTGELGYELFVAADLAADLWSALVEAGGQDGLVPAGLGARDTLRLEAGLPLYGHEFDGRTTPVEAGFMKYVALDKREDFPGKDALRRRGPPERRLVGLEMLRKSVPRSGYEVTDRGRPVGRVTSGTLSPTLGKGVAMAYVRSGLAEKGRRLEVVIRGRPIPCSVVETPFYRGTSANASAGTGGSG